MKKLIAAAVAAAIIAPVSVMAAGPTLYGKIHMSVDYKDNNGTNAPGVAYGAGKEVSEWGLNSNSSRIGVKGSEDLGNGMKVGYLIEWRVGMDGDNFGDRDLAARNRAITLSGDWGTMLAGKWDTPMKTFGRKLDLFGDQIGDLRNMNTGATLDARANNVLAYVTPNMNGFSATLAYVFSVNQLDQDGAVSGGDNSDSSAISLNAIYNNGPMMLGVGYSNYDDGVFSSSSLTGCQTAVGVNNCENETVFRVGGSYKFGDFKVLASWSGISDANGMDGKDADIWSLGGAYTMGNNTIKLQYANRSEYDDWNGSNGAKIANSGNDTGADMWALGLDHHMSKRTTVYAAYATMSNDDNSAGVVWGGGHDTDGVSAGTNSIGQFEDSDSFSVGIIHKF